ncbi:hypothetical protein [Angustibacter peucedani]
MKVSLTYLVLVPVVTAKKKCCRDKPRCKKCPVTLKRLAEMGYADREDRRVFVVVPKVPKKVMKVARQR